MAKLRSLLVWVVVGVAIVAAGVGTEYFKKSLLEGQSMAANAVDRQPSSAEEQSSEASDNKLGQIMLCIMLGGLALAGYLVSKGFMDDANIGDSSFGVWFAGGYSGASPTTKQKCGQRACRCDVHDGEAVD